MTAPYTTPDLCDHEGSDPCSHCCPCNECSDLRTEDNE